MEEEKNRFGDFVGAIFEQNSARVGHLKYSLDKPSDKEMGGVSCTLIQSERCGLSFELRSTLSSMKPELPPTICITGHSSVGPSRAIDSAVRLKHFDQNMRWKIAQEDNGR